MTHFTQEQLCFPPVEGLTVRGSFDGGALSSDFGPMLLRGIDRRPKPSTLTSIAPAARMKTGSR